MDISMDKDSIIRSCTLEKTENNSYTLKLIIGKKQIYLYNKINPQNEAIEQTDNFIFENDSLIICFGFGLGYHANSIIKKSSENNKILIVEPCREIFTEFIKIKDISNLNKNNNLNTIISKDKYELMNFFQLNISEFELKKIKIYIMPIYKEIFQKECEIFLQALKEVVISKQVDIATSIQKSKEWQDCAFNNIPFIIDSYYFHIFKDKFKSKAIILVAGGPSLNKNIDFLKLAKNKILIICMYTAYKVMKKYDIEPDMIIAIDTNQTRLEDKKELLEEINIPILYQSFLDTNLLKKHRAEKIFFTDRVERFIPSLLAKINIGLDYIPSGGSVACSAIAIAKYFGAEKVILVGQDLAFTEDKTHAEGSYYDGNGHLLINKDIDNRIMVEDIYGGTVPTIYTFYTFKIWIEHFIALNKDTLFIDATEGGALIKGTKIMRLEDAIAENIADDNIADILKDIFQMDKMLSLSQKSAFINTIDILYKDTLDLIPLIQECIFICNELDDIYTKNDDLGNVTPLLHALDELDIKIKDKNSCFEAFNMSFFNVMVDVENKKENYKTKEQSIIAQNLIIYKGLEKSVLDIQPKLKNILSSYKDKSHSNLK